MLLSFSAGTHPVTTAAADPTATDDGNAGFNVGDHWLNTASEQTFSAMDVSVGAAVWERNDQPKRNITNSDPTVGNDNTEGYEVGSTWTNTAAAPSRTWEAVDVSTGAAVWKRITNYKDTITTVDRTENDDADDAHEVGSRWYNTTNPNHLFVLIDATVGAAVWRRCPLGFRVVSSSADYNVADHDIVLVDTTSQAVTVAMPAALTDGQVHIKWATADTRERNKLTLEGQPGELIDGETDQIYGETGDSLELVSHASNWYIV